MMNKVREVRKKRGMSVSELARRANTSRNTIYNIEKGITKSIDGMLMFRIADALDTAERDIFFTPIVTHEEHNQIA